MLFTIMDISEKLGEIIRLLEDDGEEEEEGPDA